MGDRNRQQEALPVNHSTGSHVAHVTGGAAKGAVKGGAKTSLNVLAVCALVGAAVGLITVFGGWTAIGSLMAGGAAKGGADIAATTAATKAAEAAAAFGGKVLTGLGIGALVGGIVGVLAGGFSAPFGALFGGFKGAERGHESVQRDRAAATMLNAEVGAMQAQAQAYQAQAAMMQPQRPGDRYAGASTMIQTDSNAIYADSAEQVRLAGMQLQAAR